LVKLNRGNRVSSPTSEIGIMRFFDAEVAGPKLSPYLIVGLCIAFIIIVIAIKRFL